MTSCNAKNSLQAHTHLPHYSPRSHTHSAFQKIYLFLPLLSGCFVSCLSISISTNSFGKIVWLDLCGFFFFPHCFLWKKKNLSGWQYITHVCWYCRPRGLLFLFSAKSQPIKLANFNISRKKFLFEKIPSSYFSCPRIALNGIKSYQYPQCTRHTRKFSPLWCF